MKRHPLDPFSLIFGLTFAGLGAVLLVTDADVGDVPGAAWLMLPLVLAGLFLLGVGVERTRPGASEGEEPPGDT